MSPDNVLLHNEQNAFSATLENWPLSNVKKIALAMIYYLDVMIKRYMRAIDRLSVNDE